MLKDMKKQLAELLYDLGFLASRNPKDGQANVHSGKFISYSELVCQDQVLHTSSAAFFTYPFSLKIYLVL